LRATGSLLEPPPRRAEPDDLVFPTSTGSRRDKDNARERVIRPVVAHADTLLVAVTPSGSG
jgi:hypothetical protein